LLGLSADADGTQEQVNELQLSDNPQLDDETLKRLRELGALALINLLERQECGDLTRTLCSPAIFLDEVVVELVTRDVQLLLEAYLRRVTRSFGEFTVEQALAKRYQPVSA
jgi:hypothetical protein